MPSTGVKKTKKTKKANEFLTLVTDVTLVTVCGRCRGGRCDIGVGLPVRRGSRAGRPEVSQGYTGGECV